ncbi:hypothetical protein QWY20_17495 [Alkalimonas sp. MEB108]|uniref:CpXC domain-containing protein n=1 Tax=Alkalimonas cellulosilytica TaxID=3058395 RepID=A0ABU7J9M7_9GAMM|nr:hypothetical protein [Alkalimonas sp. MEB108]MEE2003250.1 hypothetical protein [Alkalimonas sp. MEB108]
MLGEEVVCPKCFFCGNFDSLPGNYYNESQDEYKATFSGTIECPSCSHSVDFSGWADFHEGQDAAHFNDFIMDFSQNAVEEEQFLSLDEYLSMYPDMTQIQMLNKGNEFYINNLAREEVPYCICGHISPRGEINYSILYTVPSWNLLVRLGLHNLSELSEAERWQKPMSQFKKKAFWNTLESLSMKYSLEIPHKWIAFLSE